MLVSSLVLLAPLSIAVPSLPQVGGDGYRLPPPDVVAVVDAPPAPTVYVSPDSAWMLLVESDAMPSIADLSRRMLRLAGTRIDPVADARYQTQFDRGLVLRDLAGENETRVPLPEGARLSSVRWSHRSHLFVYTLVTDGGTELWSASVESPEKPRRLTARLSSVLGGVVFMPDGATVLCRLVPEDRGDEPEAPAVPAGPSVQETAGHTSPLRTYQDLLGSEHDARLFEHYAAARLAVISVEDGATKLLDTEPRLYRDADPSPDGRFLLTVTVERPFSYVMPWWSFPQTVEVWDLESVRGVVLDRIPLAEGVPIGGVRTGARMHAWKTGEPATLVWAEALDGGDPKREAEHRDRWLALGPPFDGEAHELLRVEHRAWGLTYLEDRGRVVSREYDRDRRWVRSLLQELSGTAEPRVLEDRSIRDRYADPGGIETERDASGKLVAVQDGEWIYRAGSGATPEGLLPFLDRQSLTSLETERLWQCEKGAYERVARVVRSSAESKPTLVTVHEAPESPPNWRLRDLQADHISALTEFPDPTPEIRGIHKELVTYERDDGVQLSATLYLPADYEEGQRLPLLVWAYPIEFNDPTTAGQVGSSPWRFIRIRGSSHLALLTQGYAIMDGATMPVIGDPETMNDTFVEQIVGAARAAIDKAAEMGVADPERVCVGGHSYGAFMTANLLAHCDLFRAGVARSGAYNRTLTPFGFQSERRTLWEAGDTYFSVSPFMQADDIQEPLLIVHGELDNNSGTYPLQSERLFQAIKGNGGTARLVMLPQESHGYRARESVLHVQAETIDWFDRHVKGAAPLRTIEARFAEDPPGEGR